MDKHQKDRMVIYHDLSIHLYDIYHYFRTI